MVARVLEEMASGPERACSFVDIIRALNALPRERIGKSPFA
jgi:hypothetical protein